MKKKICLFGILIFCLTNLEAQLKYRSDGRLTFGNVSPVGSYTTNLFGWGHYFSWSGGGYNTYMKISLGAAAPRISGTLDQIVFYNSETSTFNSIQVQNVYNYSDRKAKANIMPIVNGLEKVMSLSPVTYNWVDSSNSLRKFENGQIMKDYGFIAQDVEEVIPEAVITDENGKKLLNYNAIISILTESVQHLSIKIDSLMAEMQAIKQNSNFKSSLLEWQDKSGGTSTQLNETSARLFQNAPNPFNKQTQISYSIPQIKQSASICIFNLNGQLMLQKNINTQGVGHVIIDGQSLPPGMYYYSLFLDNKVVETLKMLFTK